MHGGRDWKRSTTDQRGQWMEDNLVRSEANAHELRLEDGTRKRATDDRHRDECDEDNSDGIQFNGTGYEPKDGNGTDEGASMSWSEESEEEQSNGEEGADELTEEDLEWIKTGRASTWPKPSPNTGD